MLPRGVTNSTPAIWQDTIVGFPGSWQPPRRLSQIAITTTIVFSVAFSYWLLITRSPLQLQVRWHSGDSTKLLFSRTSPHLVPCVCHDHGTHHVCQIRVAGGNRDRWGPNGSFKVEPKCWELPILKVESLTGVQTGGRSIRGIRRDNIHRIKVFQHSMKIRRLSWLIQLFLRKEDDHHG